MTTIKYSIQTNFLLPLLSSLISDSQQPPTLERRVFPGAIKLPIIPSEEHIYIVPDQTAPLGNG